MKISWPYTIVRLMEALLVEKRIPLSFESLLAFDAVARLGGVRKAARDLGRDHAVVSRQIKKVEACLGVLLLQRPNGKGGAMKLTEDGLRYHSKIKNAVRVLVDARTL